MVYADKRSFCIFKKFYDTVGKKEPFSLKKLFLVIISTTRECPSTPVHRKHCVKPDKVSMQATATAAKALCFPVFV